MDTHRDHIERLLVALTDKRPHRATSNAATGCSGGPDISAADFKQAGTSSISSRANSRPGS
jgi:hypothetical protein